MIADNLKRLMLAAGLKPKSLSLKAGLNETYVRDILVGKSKQPRLACLEKLAWALDCSSEELQGRQEIAPIIDTERLRLAMLAAQDVLRGTNVPKREGEIADLTSMIYEEMTFRARIGEPITTEAEALRLMNGMARRIVVRRLKEAG